MRPQFSGWWFAAIALIGAVAYFSPQQVNVLLYKTALVAFAVCVAHLVDDAFFEDKGDDLNEIARALVFVGTVLGLTLGL